MVAKKTENVGSVSGYNWIQIENQNVLPAVQEKVDDDILMHFPV